MKTLLPTLILIICTFQIHAQTPTPANKRNLPISNNLRNVGVPLGRTIPSKTNANTAGNRHSAPSTQAIAELIGTTTYDLQTNSAGGNRIYSSGNTVAATWTMSQTLSPTYPDRGTGYNVFNGTNWDQIPTSTIDSLSWPSIDLGFGNTEYVVGHNKAPSNNDLVLLKRTPAGTGTWMKSYLPPHPAGHYCQWSKMRVGGANGATIHVIALTRPVANGGMLNNGIDGALTYSRSQDGGATWDLVHVALPMVDAAHYARMKADSYAIDVKDNTVAITQGSMFNDWILWKSADNGTSWTRSVIQQFPIAAYDSTSMSTDINGDFVADTLDVTDGSQTVLIDNNYMVHCWAGAVRIMQDPGLPFIYFPFTDGLNYWNEGFLSFPPVSIAYVADIDGDGTIVFAEGVPEYGTGLTSMPTAGIDGGSTIIVAYSGMVENTSNGMPPPMEQSYRNIYFLASTDNGQSWTDPVQFDGSAFDESVYPSIARNVGPDIHLIVQRDGEPGLSVTGTDPMGNNEIMYYVEDPGTLFNGVTVNPVHHIQMGGMVYFDQNQNGIKDAGESRMMNYPLQLSPDNAFAETNTFGIYTFQTDTGTHTVNILNGPDWITTSDSISYTVTVDTLYYNNLDFGVYPTASNYSLSTVITGGIPRCNNYITYWISYFNNGTTPTSGIVRFLKDPQLVYNIANPPVNYASADTFEWNFVNLMPFEQRMVSITVSSFGLAIGATIFNCAEVLYDNGSTGGVSEDCTSQQIICSFDPNDKAVNPPGVGIPNYVLLTDTLVYTIRFQNTGNDTAFTVRVRDTLDAIIDPASFRLIASSHPVNVIRLNGNIVVFDFENILLPDSAADEPGSNGFVKYSVRPLPGTPVGTVLNNTAHIFFDYNPAIVTNTTSNTLVDVIGLNEHVSHEMKMLVYPNPVNDETTITFSNMLNGSQQIIIRDLSGREIKRVRKFSGNSVVISASGWTSGMYFITVADGTGKIIGVEKLLVN